jgi:hypothetical protein
MMPLLLILALQAEAGAPLRGPVPFDTPEADRLLSEFQVFPPDNAWNTKVKGWARHPDSEKIVAAIGPAKPLRYNPDMAFILVPPDQPKIDVRLTAYSEESDPGPYPIPDDLPIEGWPAAWRRDRPGPAPSLLDVQRDALKAGGDRHAIVVDLSAGKLYEFFVMRRTDKGWEADCAAIFDLSSNALRPDGWTSADAAGLPIFPAVVRHDEIRRGEIRHALRVTFSRTRRAFVAPATHYASPHKDPLLPRMGERFRLRGDFDVAGFSPPVRTILVALQEYGMLVADNGIDWAVSVAPDERIPVLHEELRKVKGKDFEVVVAPK